MPRWWPTGSSSPRASSTSSPRTAARELRIGAFPSARGHARRRRRSPASRRNAADVKAVVGEGTSGGARRARALGRPARRRLLPGRGAAAARARRRGADRRRRGAVRGAAAAGPPAGRLGPPSASPPWRARRWVAPSREAADRARLRAGRLHAGDPLRLARPARQPRRSWPLGLAVTISPARLAAEFTGIAVEPLRDAPTRSVYALPAGLGRHRARARLRRRAPLRLRPARRSARLSM